MNHFGLSGRYKLQVLDGKTRKVLRETPWFDNLITDIGLDRIGEKAQVGYYMRIGTGNTTPVNADTALVSQSAYTTTIVAQSIVNAGSPNWESVGSFTYEFALGAVSGNMAEIGVGWDQSGPTLFSRALILDGLGAPSTLSVSSSEILRATYELTSYSTLTDSTGTVVIGGVTYTYTARVCEVDQVRNIYTQLPWFGVSSYHDVYSGSIGTITDSPSGSSDSISGVGTATYTPGSHYLDYTISGGITQGNVPGGIKSITTHPDAGYGAMPRTQIEFGTAIPKDGTKTISLLLRQSWGRH